MLIGANFSFAPMQILSMPIDCYVFKKIVAKVSLHSDHCFLFINSFEAIIDLRSMIKLDAIPSM